MAVVCSEGPDDRGSLYVVDLIGRRTKTIAPPPNEDSAYVYGAISGNGHEVAAWSYNALGHEIVIFDFATGAVCDRLPGPDPREGCFMAISADAKTIALGKADGRLDVLNRDNRARIALRVSDGPIRAIAFLPDRVRVVAERQFITHPEGKPGAFAGFPRIADFAVKSPER